jgi:hypothetical protein
MISSFAARAELALALLAKCSKLFLLHAADCIDGGLLCEDEGTYYIDLSNALELFHQPQD